MKLFILAISSLILLSACASKKKPSPPTQTDTINKASAPAKKVAPSSTETHWAYEGVLGPEVWGSLHKDYKLCSKGESQSPIDLKWRRPAKNGKLEFSFAGSPDSIIDNGHTIQLNFPDDANYTVIRGDKYKLIQVNFHSQSEHSLGGKHFPLEAHFIHKNAKNQIAIVAVLFKQGKPNPALGFILANWPKTKKSESLITENKFKPEGLLPKSLTHYHYSGSLTTPPCSQGVSWNVLNTAVEISTDQIKAFQAKYSNNFRPIQKLNGRRVTNY